MLVFTAQLDALIYRGVENKVTLQNVTGWLK
jgi:hypothetical protein